MEIIERISDLLAERDKTAIELCKVLDIQTSTMSTWKTRKKDPPARYMPAIANFLCVSLDYLLTGQERPAVIRTARGSRAETFRNGRRTFGFIPRTSHEQTI